MCGEVKPHCYRKRIKKINRQGVLRISRVSLTCKECLKKKEEIVRLKKASENKIKRKS